MRYSTPFASSNAMNSLKSLCSFAKLTSMPLDQFQQQIEPLFGRYARVEAIIRLIGLFETLENVSDSFHG